MNRRDFVGLTGLGATALLLPTLPPNMKVLRGTRDRLRRLVGMPPFVARSDGA